MFVEATTGKTGGQVYLIDGMSDQGFGDAIVYSHITKKKMGAVENTLLADFSITRDNCILAILSHTCEYFSQVLVNIFSQAWFSEISQVCKIVFHKYVIQFRKYDQLSQV